MSTTYQVNLKKEYKERIVPALMKEFNYTSVMQAQAREDRDKPRFGSSRGR